MHEFSVAQQAVDKIMEAALEQGAKKIRRVELLVGEHNLLGGEQFTFWIRQILSSKGEIASGVEIDLTPVKGRECVLKRIELEK